LARAAALGGFVFVILSGLLGTPVGNRNFSIIFVWIAWWALLMLVAVPLLGRGWCSICPIPMPGEWLQTRAVLGPGPGWQERPQRRWPRALRNIWLQNGAFLLMALFSAVILTQPRVTALVLAAILLLAIGTSLVFERRAFCRHVCPVGGFIGLYSEISPVELRVRSTEICTTHTEKSCYRGSAEGYGCPWNIFPASMTTNTYCGLCMECLRTCPLDNVVISVRPPGVDLFDHRRRTLDETFKALIMLGSALLYSAVFLGPWGWLKSAAYSIGSAAWWGYALAFVLAVLGLIPSLFVAAVWTGNVLSGSRHAIRHTVNHFAPGLTPLGLAAWIAFSLSFAFANISYLWPVLSDPMGWGWDLFGTVDVRWTPYFMPWAPVVQAGVLVVGLGWATAATRRLAAEDRAYRSGIRTAPIAAFHLVVTGLLLWLLVG
jgi:polyferredoxin